jgi:hypothetical protein
MFQVVDLAIKNLISTIINTISFGGVLTFSTAWVFEWISLIVLLFAGKFLFNEQDSKSKFFWTSASVLSVLEMVRIFVVF